MAYRFPRAQKHARAIGLVVMLAAAGLLGFGIGRADCAGTFWPPTWATPDG